MTKNCWACRLSKPFGDFCSNKAKKDGLNTLCRMCASKKTVEYKNRNKFVVANRQRLYRAKNKTAVLEKQKLYRKRLGKEINYTRNRAASLRKLYGISEDQYNDRLKTQSGVCAICFYPPKTTKKLSVDHDHKTKLIRGLLCDNCNRSLGLLKDDISILQRAIYYLKKYKSPQTNKI